MSNIRVYARENGIRVIEGELSYLPREGELISVGNYNEKKVYEVEVVEHHINDGVTVIANFIPLQVVDTQFDAPNAVIDDLSKSSISFIGYLMLRILEGNDYKSEYQDEVLEAFYRANEDSSAWNIYATFIKEEFAEGEYPNIKENLVSLEDFAEFFYNAFSISLDDTMPAQVEQELKALYTELKRITEGE